ncbi:TetR/AcrR family transcriptional regulator [Shouchella lehensis]|uniref:HTH-type TetR family transcriptional regulator n=1 Tax=Shouchella lehensis G1 TaxID=1246626 RepID=A0A060LYA7_9BACI|nr:TetR/AcrR family transcriptional regulator [Shouchella lehensis]AIC96231.1 HTH-type TetR family transcriptional regulator [Shouchella lehensis G1]
MNTKARIMNVARHSFSKHGYEGTTLAQIAKEVGIQKPSMYNHFKSKAELYLLLCERITNQLVDTIATTAAQYETSESKTRLYHVLKNSCDFIMYEQEGAMYKRFMLFPPADLKQDVLSIVLKGDEAIHRTLHELFQQGQKEKRFKPIPEQMFRSAYFCLLDGLFTESFIYEDDDFQRRFKEAWTIFWYGISTDSL